MLGEAGGAGRNDSRAPAGEGAHENRKANVDVPRGDLENFLSVSYAVDLGRPKD